MPPKLYGPYGSVWEKVDYIPHECDHMGTVRFSRDGNYYRNSLGETYQMIERGRDNWASDVNWKGGEHKK